MNIIFLPVACDELIQAFDFYEQQLKGLGEQFLNEIFEAVGLIQVYPQSYQFITPHTRKCPLHKFPYLILYGIIDNTVVVSAIAHQHRKPSSYLDRN